MKGAITISIDPEIKKQVVEILKQKGQKMSSVIELHLKEIIKENAKTD